MGMYEKPRQDSQQEDAMLIASGAWMTVRAAQGFAKTKKRIWALLVLALLFLLAPALGHIVTAVQSILM